MYFKGTRDSNYKREESAWGVVEFLKCTEDTRLPGYPECAPREEIDRFLERRRAIFKVISE